MLDEEAYREATEKQPNVIERRGAREMITAYRQEGPCKTVTAVRFALKLPSRIPRGTLSQCDSFLKDNGIIAEAYCVPKRPSPDSVAEAGEAIPPVQPSARADEQMELRKKHARQIADDLYSLVDSGGKKKYCFDGGPPLILLVSPWTYKYPLLQRQMRPAWEHLQSYPVAQEAVAEAVAAWDDHVRLLTEMKKLLSVKFSSTLLNLANPSAVSVTRDILRDIDSTPKNKGIPDLLPRYETLLSAWGEMLVAEKRANDVVREIVVQLRNGTPLGGTCELGY